MTLTDSINDTVEQAARLLSPPDLSDWTPPDGPPDVQAQAEQTERERRERARIDAYLADRSDRLAMLKVIRSQALARADAYEDQAAPWERRAARAKGLARYCEELAVNVLVAERAAAGFDRTDPYEVEQRDGTKIGLKLSTPAVRILNVEELPGKFVKLTKTPDKTEIARAIKAGQIVTGAVLERGCHLSWGR